MRIECLQGVTIVKVTDKSKQFVNANGDALDRVLAQMAVDIERLAKQQVPHKTGALQTSGHFERMGFCKYRVFFNKVYARRWEYETPKNGFKEGRKSHYLGDPAKTITAQGKPRIKAMLNGVRI